jgi:hypothetical protein
MTTAPIIESLTTEPDLSRFLGTSPLGAIPVDFSNLQTDHPTPDCMLEAALRQTLGSSFHDDIIFVLNRIHFLSTEGYASTPGKFAYQQRELLPPRTVRKYESELLMGDDDAQPYRGYSEVQKVYLRLRGCGTSVFDKWCDASATIPPFGHVLDGWPRAHDGVRLESERRTWVTAAATLIDGPRRLSKTRFTQPGKEHRFWQRQHEEFPDANLTQWDRPNVYHGLIHNSKTFTVNGTFCSIGFDENWEYNQSTQDELNEIWDRPDYYINWYDLRTFKAAQHKFVEQNPGRRVFERALAELRGQMRTRAVYSRSMSAGTGKNGGVYSMTQRKEMPTDRSLTTVRPIDTRKEVFDGPVVNVWHQPNHLVFEKRENETEQDFEARLFAKPRYTGEHVVLLGDKAVPWDEIYSQGEHQVSIDGEEVIVTDWWTKTTKARSLDYGNYLDPRIDTDNGDRERDEFFEPSEEQMARWLKKYTADGKFKKKTHPRFRKPLPKWGFPNQTDEAKPIAKAIGSYSAEQIEDEDTVAEEGVYTEFDDTDGAANAVEAFENLFADAPEDVAVDTDSSADEWSIAQVKHPDFIERLDLPGLHDHLIWNVVGEFGYVRRGWNPVRIPWSADPDFKKSMPGTSRPLPVYQSGALPEGFAQAVTYLPPLRRPERWLIPEEDQEKWSDFDVRETSYFDPDTWVCPCYVISRDEVKNTKPLRGSLRNLYLLKNPLSTRRLVAEWENKLRAGSDYDRCEHDRLLHFYSYGYKYYPGDLRLGIIFTTDEKNRPVDSSEAIKLAPLSWDKAIQNTFGMIPWGDDLPPDGLYILKTTANAAARVYAIWEPPEMSDPWDDTEPIAVTEAEFKDIAPTWSAQTAARQVASSIRSARQPETLRRQILDTIQSGDSARVAYLSFHWDGATRKLGFTIAFTGASAASLIESITYEY